MEMRLILFTVGFAVASLDAAVVKHCCAPPLWESQNMIVETRVVNGSTEFTQRVEQMSVDGPKQLVAFIATITKQSNTTNVHIIQDYKASTEYRLYGNPPNLCLQDPLSPWVPMCIPENSTLVFSGYRGQASRMKVDTYRFTFPGLIYHMTVDQLDCTPVDVNVFGSNDNVPRMITKTYSNLTIGIKDRAVFDIPVFCHHKN